MKELIFAIMLIIGSIFIARLVDASPPSAVMSGLPYPPPFTDLHTLDEDAELEYYIGLMMEWKRKNQVMVQSIGNVLRTAEYIKTEVHCNVHNHEVFIHWEGCYEPRMYSQLILQKEVAHLLDVSASKLFPITFILTENVTSPAHCEVSLKSWGTPIINKRLMNDLSR